jgi:uncharacterized protein
MSTTLKPISPYKRDISLDVLRGFALTGVLFMFCVSDIGAPAKYANSFLDELIAWPKWILIEGRMYTMLILIFGIGFHVQLKKAKEHNVSLAPVFLRRLTGLLLIGFIHAILLSTRDILMFYGIAGLMLLFVGNASNRLLFIILFFLFILLITPVIPLVFGNPWRHAHSLAQPNNYADHLQHNWEYFKLKHQFYTVYVDMFFHFLLGFWISKSGLWQKLKTGKKLRRTLLIISLASAIVLIPVYYFWLNGDAMQNLLAQSSFWQRFLVTTLIGLLYQLWMMVSATLYSVLLINISASAKGRKWFRPLAAFGQMALSNYLVQSLVLVPYLLVFDKFDNLPPFNGLILFVPVFILQLLFSTWWMSRYQLGPFEWLLRSITYWNRQQLRKPQPVTQEG